MMDYLAQSLQENILVLLCYSEKNHKFIRNVVDVDLFESPYREVINRVYSYIDAYNEPPGDHIGDLLEDLLDNESKGKIYVRVLENIIKSQQSVSEKYTLDRLDKFVRQQNMKAGVLEAADLLQSDDPDLDYAETVLSSKMKSRLNVFDHGTMLNDSKALSKIFEEEAPCFPTGIKEFDAAGLGPIRGGLYLYVGGAKSGKSMHLLNLGRQSLLQGYNVLVVTLEMSETYYLQRFIQNMCGIPQRPADFIVPGFKVDSAGELQDFKFKSLSFKKGLASKGIQKEVIDKVSRWKKRRKNLVIKSFPTGQLTTQGLNAYLDRLQESTGFIPDLLLLDYPDLMAVDANNLRISLGDIYKQIRGLAVERDIAVATVSQSNRDGVKNKKVTDTSVAEDYSKIATADCIITYNKTELENKMGLARLLVAAARNGADKFEVAIAQNYSLCQFVVDSMPITNKYHDLLKDAAED